MSRPAASAADDSGAGPETRAARELYQLSPYTVAPPLLRSVATVKIAAARCNAELGYLSPETAEAVILSGRELQQLDDERLSAEISLDAYQGGAGTSVNMAVNEWIAHRAAGHLRPPNYPGTVIEVDAHGVVNLHQSTNDVMPTALRLMMHDLLEELELVAEELQSSLQKGEERYDLTVKIGRTQLRDAVVTSLGREYATWAHALSRDRWRCFKARERIREVNLGGTAIGTGAGAPRRYVLQVSRYLQQEVDHPISRAEHLVEATSNYDQIVEAMDAPKCLAVDLRRIASDLRLLAGGPRSGFGELELPELLPGSSIMAGKVNPVIPEAVIQVAERVIVNDTLISRLAGMSELELNAFFPAISQTVYESLTLAIGATRSLAAYIPKLTPRAAGGKGVRHPSPGQPSGNSQAEAVALLPLLTYEECTLLLRHAEEAGTSLRQFLIDKKSLAPEEAEAIFAPSNLLSLGYDEALYADLRDRRGAQLATLVTACKNKEAQH